MAYYAVTAFGDTWTTWEGLRRGFREATLKAVFLTRLGLDPLAVYPVAFVIAGHGHLAGFLWNLGALGQFHHQFPVLGAYPEFS